MPRIIEFEAPDRRLTPDERGNEAFTRAGRYTGQYIRQTAEDVKQGGILQGQEIRQRGWPFDILAIEEAQAKQKQGGSVQVRSGGGGGGIRNAPTRTDGASLDAAARRELDGYSAVSGRYKTSAATRSQISSGARALGNISRALAANSESDLGDPSGVSVLHGTQDTMLDPDTGLYVTDPSAPQLAAMRKQYANDLTYMQAGGPNAGADAAANQRGDLIGAAGATGQYWRNYYGVSSTPDGGISNGVDPNSVDQYGNPIPRTPVDIPTDYPTGQFVSDVASDVGNQLETGLGVVGQAVSDAAAPLDATQSVDDLYSSAATGGM